MAALAFTCLERERLVGARLAAELRAATRGVRRRMVEAQGQDGFFGNVYSTPWAMQVGAVCRGLQGADVGAWAEAAALGQAMLSTSSAVPVAQGPDLPPT